MVELKDILNDDYKVQMIAQKSFEMVDIDKSGIISVDELEMMITEISTNLSLQPPSRAEVRRAFRDVDSNRNNKITLDEWTILIREVIKILASS